MRKWIVAIRDDANEPTVEMMGLVKIKYGS
jgi:hypothetical protein